MTARQRRYWQQLWGLVQQTADEQESPDPMETDPPAEASMWEMTAIENACLRLCIELLNKRYRTQEYESLLVYAMAVLGRSEKGWWDAGSYPPILSQVIKVVRFLLVQKALWINPNTQEIIALWQSQAITPSLLATAEEALYESDEGFAEASPPMIPSSPPSSVRGGDGAPMARILRAGRKPFQDCVEWILRQFMVCGTHGPMQTLLYWRTYGLKIHYNTTAPGHATWMGQERLLYQQVQSTMSGFRGLVHGPVGAARALLGELLQESDLALGLPAIPWDGLFDDPAEQTPGWSFLRDQRTALSVDGRVWMAGGARGAAAGDDTGGIQPAQDPAVFAAGGSLHSMVMLPSHPLVILPRRSRSWPPAARIPMTVWARLPTSTIADEQAGHSPHVAGMVYGRESHEFMGSTMLRWLKFRASSTDWHC